MTGQGNQQVTIWEEAASEPWQSQEISSPRGLTLTTTRRHPRWVEEPSDVVVQPLTAHAGTVAALFRCGPRTVDINGIPASVGMHLLQHGDRLDVHGQTFWISARASVELAAYNPALHGEDVFCFLTKARLTPGQQIKICPGLPGARCGVIYKAEAWDMAMQSKTPMKCPNCGYWPGEAKWHPPQPRVRKSIDGLLQLARK